MRRPVLLIGAVAGVLAAALAGLLVFANPFGAPARVVNAARLLDPAKFSAAQQPVVTRINAAPEDAEFFVALGEAFPKDQTRILDALGQNALAAASPDLALGEAVRSLSQSRGILAARASEAALDTVFAAQAEVAGALAKADARLCVDFIYGSASQGYYDFAAANRALTSAYALAGLNAIVDGQRAKLERDKPSEADFKALETVLTGAGLSKPEIAAFIDGAPPDPPLPDDRLCAAGLTYFKTLARLPAPLRMRFYGLMTELMSKG